MDKQYPLVSIYIPSYNHENYVRLTLDSILADSYPNKEIVIIDDASTDHTWCKVQEWIEKHGAEIKVSAKRHDENKGITKTLNELTALCSGVYLVGIASDDYLIGDSIIQRVNYLNKNPDKSAVFGDCIVIDDSGSQLYESGLSELYHMNKANLLNGATITKELIVNWGVPGGTLMVEKNIHDTLKFDESLLVEDFDFYLKLLAARKLGFLNEKISAYRLHGTNSSRVQRFKWKRHVGFVKTCFSNLRLFPWQIKLVIIYALIVKVLTSAMKR